MRLLILIASLFSFLLSESKISYDRTNIELERVLYKSVNNLNDLSLNPALDESRALYNLGRLNDVVMATTLSTTLEGIYKQNPSKLSKYQIVAPLKKGKLHLVVNKNSPYRTIYDLDGRNLNVGKENNGIHLFSRTLSNSLNIYFKPQFYAQKDAISAVISGALDAVLFVSDEPEEILVAYKEHIRLINIPVIDGFTNTVIKKENYALEDDINTINADLVLLAKKSFIQSYGQTSQIIKNLLNHNKSRLGELCSNNYYKVELSTYFTSECSAIKVKQAESKKSTFKSKRKEKSTFTLVKPINSIEDVVVYYQSFKGIKTLGGLNKKTELDKLKKVVQFYKEESEESSPSKLLIKSYSNHNDSYTQGKLISKKLRKLGINRNYIIIKSFNRKTSYKNDDKRHNYLNKIIKFEILWFINIYVIP